MPAVIRMPASKVYAVAVEVGGLVQDDSITIVIVLDMSWRSLVDSDPPLHNLGEDRMIHVLTTLW